MWLLADGWHKKYHVMWRRRRVILRIFAEYSDRYRKIPKAYMTNLRLFLDHTFWLFSHEKKKNWAEKIEFLFLEYALYLCENSQKLWFLQRFLSFNIFLLFVMFRNHDSIYIWSIYCRYNLPKKGGKLILLVSQKACLRLKQGLLKVCFKYPCFLPKRLPCVGRLIEDPVKGLSFFLVLRVY